MSIHSKALKKEIAALSHNQARAALVALVNSIEALGGLAYIKMDSMDALIELTKKVNR